MKIGVIAAMEEELIPLMGWFEQQTQSARAPVLLREGRVGAHHICVVRSDPGKVNAALATQALLERFSPQLLVNVGSSGAISPVLEVGDLAIADALIQHDFDLSAFGLSRGELVFDLEMNSGDVGMVFRRQKHFETAKSYSDTLVQIASELALAGSLAKLTENAPRVHRGTFVSGDQFIAGPSQAANLVLEFGALCADMEAAAIAHVAAMNGVPFVSLRAMSDRADHSAHVHFGEFLRAATANYGAVLRAFFQSIETPEA